MKQERYAKANRTLYHARLAVIGEWAKVMPSTTFFVTLGTILILWFRGLMVLQGEMSVGELVAFNAYVLMLSNPMDSLPGW